MLKNGQAIIYYELQQSNQGKHRNENLIRSGAQAGLTAGHTRATFILSIDLLDDVKNYAYTKRLKMKDAVEKLLQQSIDIYKENGGQLIDRNGE